MAHTRSSIHFDNDDNEIDDTDQLAHVPILHIGLNRASTYQHDPNTGISTFLNPLYTGYPAKYDIEVQLGSEMRLKDFLASIPSFSDFSEQQLLLLERRASISKYNVNEVIFYQGQKGDAFYVIHSGAVDICIQEDVTLLPHDVGSIVNRLTEGCYFGERALMTSEPRAATVRANQNTVCLVFSRQTFEDAISGSNALLGNDINDNIDWSKDHETRSLYRHIEKIIKIEKMESTSIKTKRILYELTTAFTPELSADEVIARMVMTIKVALKGDRVGLFVLSEDKKSMVLKVSERSKGIRLPIKGLAGSVIESNQAMNIPDAYKDERFDNTMDRRTGYRTRQVLGVPVRHPLSGEAIGLLQVNNRLDGSHDAFTAEEQGFLELAAEQLSELLYGRADVFLNAGTSNSTDNESEVAVVNSADVMTPFQVELISFNFYFEEYVNPSFKYLEIVVSLHLGVSPLCHSRSFIMEIPYPDGSSSKRRKSIVANGGEMALNLRNRLIFNISTRDLPRAARILFRVGGSKKKKGPFEPIGWAAAPIFDFKGRMDCQVSVNLFEGDNDVPINTTLSNTHNDRSPSLSAVLSADLILNSNPNTPRITIIHSMPINSKAIQGAVEHFTESSMMELERILLLSFNPLSTQLLTPEDKEFLWSLRYNILDRPELLAAFLMCVQWQNAEHVQEVYELLDLWEPPLPAQALQLLDRRFMDPKIRAFAVHCLEELDDDELALYMLQLCQQLKFENHADSALSRFLLRRSLANKRLIGHIFFWQLQSEAQNVDVRQRFITLLQVCYFLSFLD